MKKLRNIYISILFILAVIPINGTHSALNNNYILNIRWDYLVHALVYIPLYPLMMLSKTSKFELSKLLNLKPINIKYILISLIIATAFEAVQILTPWRTFNVNDLMSNMLGVIIGVLGLVLILIINKNYVR